MESLRKYYREQQSAFGGKLPDSLERVFAIYLDMAAKPHASHHAILECMKFSVKSFLDKGKI